MTRSSATVAALLLVPAALVAQDRLKTMPGYEAAQRAARDVPIAIAGAVTNVAWPDARSPQAPRTAVAPRSLNHQEADGMATS